jgi:hypothetical protein
MMVLLFLTQQTAATEAKILIAVLFIFLAEIKLLSKRPEGVF